MNNIVEHKDWQHVTYREFLSDLYHRKGHGGLPPETSVIGQIEAYINHGRWIAECPTRCGGAVIADSGVPLFVCYECGGDWYSVVFPPEKTAIEVLLMRRPPVGREPTTRNWYPGESVADLARQNQEMGV